jgi:hypothetical protein
VSWERLVSLEQTPCGAFDCNPGATTCTGQCGSQTPCGQYACGGTYAPPSDPSYGIGSARPGQRWHRRLLGLHARRMDQPTNPQRPASHNGHYGAGCGFFGLRCAASFLADATVSSWNASMSALSKAGDRIAGGLSDAADLLPPNAIQFTQMAADTENTCLARISRLKAACSVCRKLRSG